MDKERLDKIIADCEKAQYLFSNIKYKKMPQILKISIKVLYKYIKKNFKIVKKNYNKFLSGEYNYADYINIEEFENNIKHLMEFEGLLKKFAEIK